MRVVVNKNEYYCVDCTSVGVDVIRGSSVVCSVCGSPNLVDREKGLHFNPIFGDDPNSTYKVSRYTPELPCRRKRKAKYPIIRDRRAH